MKVKYTQLAIIDLSLNFYVEPEGMEPKKVRISHTLSMVSKTFDLKAMLEQEIRKEFGIEGSIELENVTPPMPELPALGEDDVRIFGGGCDCCCRSDGRLAGR